MINITYFRLTLIGIILAILFFLITRNVSAWFFPPQPSLPPLPWEDDYICEYYPEWCEEPLPSSSPNPSPSATPEPSGEPSPSPSTQPNPNPSVEPSITPTLALSPAGGAEVCIGTNIEHAPTVLEVKRIDSDSIYIRWSSVDGHIKNYIIEYGLEQDKPLWNTKVENVLSTELNYLPPDRHIWVRVRGTDDCILGNPSLWIDP